MLQGKRCACSSPLLSHAPQGSLWDPGTGETQKGLGEAGGCRGGRQSTKGRTHIAGVWDMLQPLGVCKRLGTAPGTRAGCGVWCSSMGTRPAAGQLAPILIQPSGGAKGLAGC